MENQISWEDVWGVVQVFSLKVLAAVAKGELDLNAIAKQELANRGFNASGKWVGFSWTAGRYRCPNCKGPGVKISEDSPWEVFECADCHAIFSKFIPLAEIEKYVNVFDWAEDEKKWDERYFEFIYPHKGSKRKIHGWFDANSKKKVQEG